MKVETVIVYRFIKDYMIAIELSSHTFEIKSDLILSVKKPEVDINKNQYKRNHAKKKKK